MERDRRREKKHTEGPRKTNSSLRCHYLHKSAVFFSSSSVNVCEARGTLKGRRGNWLGEEEGGERTRRRRISGGAAMMSLEMKRHSQVSRLVVYEFVISFYLSHTHWQYHHHPSYGPLVPVGGHTKHTQRHEATFTPRMESFLLQLASLIHSGGITAFVGSLCSPLLRTVAGKK